MMSAQAICTSPLCKEGAFGLSYRASWADGSSKTVPVPWRFCPTHGPVPDLSRKKAYVQAMEDEEADLAGVR